MRLFQQPLHNLSYHVRMRAFLFLLALTTYAQDACEVHLRFVTPRGTLVLYKITQFLGSHGKDEKAKFQDGHAAVPCGHYFYVVQRTDIDVPGTNIRGEIKLMKALTAQTLIADHVLMEDKATGKVHMLAIDGFAPIGPRITASIGSSSLQQADWFVITSLLEDRRTEGPVRPDASFLSYDDLRGIANLTLFHKSKVIHTETVEITDRPLRIPFRPTN